MYYRSFAVDADNGKSWKNGLRVTATVCIGVFFVVGCFATRGECTSAPHPRIIEPVDMTRMPTPVQAPSAPKPEIERLPDTLKPYHYDVYLKAYIDDELYPSGEKFLDIRGTTKIFVNCLKSTSAIYVHIRYISIDAASIDIVDITGDPGRKISVSSTDDSELDTNHWFIIKTAEPLQKNHQYTIHLNHVGTLNQTDHLGFYYGKYKEYGTQKRFAATQFEKRLARRAFPCFDEPAMKATFNTTLVYRPGRMALSNTDVIRNDTFQDSIGNVWIETQYEKTVVMSTYLLAYAIGEWACIHDITRHGIRFGACSRLSFIDQAEYALRAGMELITMYEDLFDMKYALPKMDMLAVPVFPTGAMENWGLILYHESDMIYNPDVHPPSRKKLVATVVAHELAHEWFGDAVTTVWWSDLWLNEGFASFFECYGLDFVEKSFHEFDQFFLQTNTYQAFAHDQVGTSRPVVTPRTDGDMIYLKGAALIQMIRNFLGDDVFFEGLRRYLRRNEWGNTFTDDLWQSLTETHDDLSGTSMRDSLDYDMKGLMDTWFLQMGFPVVKLTRTSTNLVTAAQEQFFLDPNDSPKDEHYTNLGYVWHVPLTYTHEAELDFNYPKRFWLHETRDSVVLDGLVSDLHWYIANINQSAYIRVNYDLDNWRKLANQLQLDHKAIPVRNRVHLIDDVFHLGQAHHIDHVIALEIIGYLSSEDDYAPWQAFSADQFYTRHMLLRTLTYETYEKYIRKLVSPNYESVGWEFDYKKETIDYYRRVYILRLSCLYNHPDCIQTASAQFKAWMADPHINLIEVNMRSTVYSAAIRYGTDAEWQFAYDRHKDGDKHEKEILQFAMAASRNASTLKRYMEEALENGDFKATTIIDHVRASSALGFKLAWDFTVENFDVLESKYDEDAYGIVWSFAEIMNTDEDLQALQGFGTKYHQGMPRKERKKFNHAVQSVKTNIKWVERNMADINQFLDARFHGL